MIKPILLNLVLAIALLLNLTVIYPVLATETSNGRKIFNTNCAACHIGGANILVENKTLQKEALSKYLENYDINPIQAIIHQVQNGKSAMPAFKNKLSEQEILEVAAYVFQKAETGW
nr:c-type cytochrome [Sphaerospermopsis aphanizomenoides]